MWADQTGSIVLVRSFFMPVLSICCDLFCILSL